LPEAAVSDILLQNVNITAENPFGIFYARNIHFENCKIITHEGENKLASTHAEIFITGK